MPEVVSVHAGSVGTKERVKGRVPVAGNKQFKSEMAMLTGGDSPAPGFWASLE